MEVNGNVLTEEGTYVDTLASANGCDSIITTVLTFSNSMVHESEASICEGDSVLFGNNYYSQAGIYVDTLMAVNGCDSIVSFELSFVAPTTSSQSLAICQGGSVEVNGNVLTEEGTYVDTLASANGCDSIITTVLTFSNSMVHESEASICEGDSVLFGNNYYSQAGIYVDTLMAVNGCDSIISFELIFTSPIAISQQLSFCEGDSIYLNGQFYQEEGTVTDTLASTGGCDSIVTTLLTYADHYEEVFEYSICEGDSIWMADQYFSTDTTVIEILQSTMGCDSVLVHELTTKPDLHIATADTIICRGERVQLLVEGATNVQWSPAAGLSCTDCTDPIASPEFTTVYSVTAVNCFGDTIEATALVEVYQLPQVEITLDESTAMGDSLLLSVWVDDPFANFVVYNLAGEVVCENCTEIYVQKAPTMRYTVVAINEEGCEADDHVLLTYSEDCPDGDLLTANFITPNNDGANDFFEVRYNNAFLDISLVRIFNRWGELVFESRDVVNDKWDGTFRGRLVNPGVYVFYLEGDCVLGEHYLITGNITVIR